MNREGISFLNESRNLIPNEDPTPKKGRNVRRAPSSASRGLQVPPPTRPKTNVSPGNDVAGVSPGAFEEFLQSSWSASPAGDPDLRQRPSAGAEKPTLRGPASTPPAESATSWATPVRSDGSTPQFLQAAPNVFADSPNRPTRAAGTISTAFATGEDARNFSEPLNAPATLPESDAVEGRALPEGELKETSAHGDRGVVGGNAGDTSDTPGSSGESMSPRAEVLVSKTVQENLAGEDIRSSASPSNGLLSEAPHETKGLAAPESWPTSANSVGQENSEGGVLSPFSKETSAVGASGRRTTPLQQEIAILNASAEHSEGLEPAADHVGESAGSGSRSETATLEKVYVEKSGGDAQIQTGSRGTLGGKPVETTNQSVETLEGPNATPGDVSIVPGEPSMSVELEIDAPLRGGFAPVSLEKSRVNLSRADGIRGDSPNGLLSSLSSAEPEGETFSGAVVLEPSAAHQNGERLRPSQDSGHTVEERSDRHGQHHASLDSDGSSIPATDGEPAEALRFSTMNRSEIESLPAVGSTPRSDSSLLARTEPATPTARPTPPEPLVWTPRVLHDLALKARDFLAKGHTEIRLRLDPPHLGKLRVRLDISEGKIAAHLLASSSETAALLERDRQELVKAFEAQGISEVSVEVDADSREGFASWFEEREDDSPRSTALAMPKATRVQSPKGRSRSLVDVVA